MLRQLTMHPGIDTLGERAFFNCNALISVVFPASVTKILTATFSGCSGLTEMVFLGQTPPTLANVSNSLGSNSYNWPIYVPDESVSAYKAASGWSNYASRVKGISERPTQ